MYSGMKKINFSGGEPFIHQKGNFIGELVQYCKQDLKLSSVTIVSNGSLITEEWFQKYGMLFYIFDIQDTISILCPCFLTLLFVKSIQSLV